MNVPRDTIKNDHINWQPNYCISYAGLGNTAPIQFNVVNGPIGSKDSEITFSETHQDNLKNQHTQTPQNPKHLFIAPSFLCVFISEAVRLASLNAASCLPIYTVPLIWRQGNPLMNNKKASLTSMTRSW